MFSGKSLFFSFEAILETIENILSSFLDFVGGVRSLFAMFTKPNIAFYVVYS